MRMARKWKTHVLLFRIQIPEWTERHSTHSAPRGRMNRMLRMHSVSTILIPEFWIKKRALRLQSAAAEHAHQTAHYMNWKNVKCVESDQHWYSRRVKEDIQNQLHPNNLSMDSGIEISKAWLPNVRKHQRHKPTSEEAPLAAFGSRDPYKSEPDSSLHIAWRRLAVRSRNVAIHQDYLREIIE